MDRHNNSSNAAEGTPEDVEKIRASLEELDAIIDALVKQKDMERAIQFALRAVDIRRRCFGLGSEELELSRVKAAQMLVVAARVQQARELHKETAELLAHVDSLTEHVLPTNLVSLDRARRVVRLQMMKDLMIARFRQGRHRSALTFGKHVIELARDTMCLYELPSLHLNLASVHSALAQHREALRHCYIAFQKLCLILEALDDPESHPFVTTALSLELLDADGAANHGKAFEIFVRCCSLVKTELGDDVDMSVDAPNVRAGSGLHGNDMPPDRRRWGGVLALAFRSLAAEQEHLGQIDGALLTYKVSHTTALSSLGSDHPITLQCEQALRDAEQAAKTRLSRISTSRAGGGGGNTASVGQPNAHGATNASQQGGNSMLLHSIGGSTRGSAPAGGRAAAKQKLQSLISAQESLAQGGAKRAAAVLRRPAWNPWFNSDGPVPSHYEETFRVEALRRAGVPQSPDGSLDVSAIDRSLSSAAPAAKPNNSSTVSHRHHLVEHRRTPSPLPPRPGTTSLGAIPLRTTKAARSGTAPNDADHAADDGVDENEFPVVEPISLADFSFLQNTFKLRYDINFNRPHQRYTTMTQRQRDNNELRELTEERRRAEELAAELGM